MNIRECGDGVYISSQIFVADLPKISTVGIRTIICNRPDREAREQPDFRLIQKAATEYGMHFYYIPVAHSGIVEGALQKMITVLDHAERPLLAYCRSGKRSDTIYRLAKKIWKGNK